MEPFWTAEALVSLTLLTSRNLALNGNSLQYKYYELCNSLFGNSEAPWARALLPRGRLWPQRSQCFCTSAPSHHCFLSSVRLGIGLPHFLPLGIKRGSAHPGRLPQCETAHHLCTALTATTEGSWVCVYILVTTKDWDTWWVTVLSPCR